MVVLGGSTTKITLKHFPLKMSSVIENADRRLNVATESLRIAEEEFREWKLANQPLDTTHPTYLDLKAEVTACRAREVRVEQTLIELSQNEAAQIIAELRAREERAQQTLQQALAAQNRGKLVV